MVRGEEYVQGSMVGTHLDVVQGAAGRETPNLRDNPVRVEKVENVVLLRAVAGEDAVARSLRPGHPDGLPAQG